MRSDDGDRVQRILAYIFAAMVAMTVIAFFAILIGSLMGVQGDDFGTGIWPIVFLTPLIALPAAFLLMIALVVVVARRRSREAAARPAPAPSRSPRRR